MRSVVPFAFLACFAFMGARAAAHGDGWGAFLVGISVGLLVAILVDVLARLGRR